MRDVILTFLVATCLYACLADPSSRAKEFMENVYSGKTMQVEDWIAADTRSSRLFNIYGGIDALVKDNYAEALRNQGFKSVKVLNVNRQHSVYTVNFAVIFKLPPPNL